MSSLERRSVIATSSPSSYSGYSLPSRYPAAIPSSADAVQHLRHRRLEPHRELPHDGRLVEQLDAVEPRQPLARVRGAPGEQLAELDDAALAEPGEVDHARRARSAPARCRCCGSPSRGGCAARGSAARARSRGGRRRRWSRRRSGPASGAGAPRWRRRSRTRARRSRAGRRAGWPSPTATSTPHSPGRPQHARGSARRPTPTVSAPACLAAPRGPRGPRPRRGSSGSGRTRRRCRSRAPPRARRRP